jgi:hypothetical protein
LEKTLSHSDHLPEWAEHGIRKSLAAAADLLETHGWLRRRCGDKLKGLDVGHAIAEGTSGNAVPVRWAHRYFSDFHVIDDLTKWNDAQTDVKVVTAALRDAACGRT